MPSSSVASSVRHGRKHVDEKFADGAVEDSQLVQRTTHGLHSTMWGTSLKSSFNVLLIRRKGVGLNHFNLFEENKNNWQKC
eukprot:5108063-Amphidinium_carterae.1